MSKQNPLASGYPVPSPRKESHSVFSSSEAGAESDGAAESPGDTLFAPVDILLALAIGAGVGVAYLPIIQGMLNGKSDYVAHAYFAQMLAEQGTLLSPACLLHLVVAALVQSGLAASYKSATLGLVVCSHAAVGAVLYLCARWAIGARRGFLGRFLPAAVAVLGPFIQPLVSRQATYSIGYIWAEPYHSPTYALLKPFALASTAFAVYFLAGARKPDWRIISLCAFTVAAGTLAKPSFAICALPALVLCSAYRYARKAPFSQVGVLYGWLVPALAVLGWQFYRTYAAAVADPSHYADSIVFAPLAVMRMYTKEVAAPYFWSTLLPLCVLVLYGRRAWADAGLRFSLIAFLFGTAYTYTLAEQLRFNAGNFLWSSYITLFIVYFFATVFVVKQILHQSTAAAEWVRALPCLAILAWHLTCGFWVHTNFIHLYH